jgi:hypothetical protein
MFIRRLDDFQGERKHAWSREGPVYPLPTQKELKARAGRQRPYTLVRVFLPYLLRGPNKALPPAPVSPAGYCR